MKGFVQDIWWLLLLRGIVLLLLGFAAVTWPGATFATLALYLAFYILISGIINILVSIGGITHKSVWFLPLVLGIIEIAAGAYLFKYPLLAASTLIMTVGFLFIVQGIFAIIVSFVDTRDAGMKLLEIISGVLGIVAGLIIIRNPLEGAIVFAWVLGVYGLIAGTINIAAALSVRQMAKEVESTISPRRETARA